MRLSDIAVALDCELIGDGGIEISGVAGLEHAGPTELTFLANPKYGTRVKTTRAAAILVSEPVKQASITAGVRVARNKQRFAEVGSSLLSGDIDTSSTSAETSGSP